MAEQVAPRQIEAHWPGKAATAVASPQCQDMVLGRVIGFFRIKAIGIVEHAHEAGNGCLA